MASGLEYATYVRMRCVCARRTRLKKGIAARQSCVRSSTCQRSRRDECVHQDTLYRVHEGDQLQDGGGLNARAGSVHSFEQDGRDRVETREASLQQQRLACGAAARDPVRVGDASDSDELCHCSRRWSQRRAFDSNGNASRVYASTEQPDSDGARPRPSLATALPLTFHFTPPSCQLLPTMFWKWAIVS